MPITLDELNQASTEQAAAMLDGLYEHSPWVAQAALPLRPFHSLTHLKHSMARIVADAGKQAQLTLIRAHPELAGKAMVSKTLTAESTHEQGKAGLTDCTPQEFTRIQKLNTDYKAKFGFPFILAVLGARGAGLSKQEIIDTFARRLENSPDEELAQSLRNIHRIVEMRLNVKFGVQPSLGDLVWDWHESLAQFSDPGFAEQGQLTVTYLTQAHRAAAAQIADNMKRCGFDEVTVDAVGNVVGRYRATQPGAKTLMTGSHYDTVRNAGKYDGRLGIFTPMACVRELSRQGRRLPFALEVVGFAEEEGQRYKASFLGSGALIGGFKPEWLDLRDDEGISMREAMQAAGHAGTMEAIAALRRKQQDYLGFVEVHIEQGPVLAQADLPLGIVTSINGSLRYQCEVLGTASHAGTTPMNQRRDAVLAVAELALYMEQRATRDADSVATMGMLQVPGGSVNVVPGRCQFSLDMRAPTDAQRDALAADVLAQLHSLCEARGLRCSALEVLRAAAAPSDAQWQQRWEKAVQALGVPVFRLPSGAGHDAMKLHELMPQAMLFVRGQNNGISHNPLESTTSDDMELAVQSFMALLDQLSQESASVGAPT